jgi:PIN domain nuclease of toxin-antitoxin system
MASKVLDAYALMAFFEDEPGADVVRNLLLKAEDGNLKLLISVVNLGEVWYSIAQWEYLVRGLLCGCADEESHSRIDYG